MMEMDIFEIDEWLDVCNKILEKEKKAMGLNV
jgi:hypothetical protein